MKLNELRKLVKETISETKRNRRPRRDWNSIVESTCTDVLLSEDKQSQRAGYNPSEGQTKTAFKKLSDALKKGDVPGVRAILDSPVMTTGAVQDILDKGDGGDDAIKIKDGSKLAKELVPTQGFIDCMQSAAGILSAVAILEQYANPSKPIEPGDALSISGNFILDGHHRWSGILAANPEAPIKTRDFQIPGNAGQKLGTLQVAVAAKRQDGNKLPSKGGDAKQNILGESESGIKTLLDKNTGVAATDGFIKGKGGIAFLGDEYMQELQSASAEALALFGLQASDSGFQDKDGNDLQALPLDQCKGKGSSCPVRAKIIGQVSKNLSSMPDQAAGSPANREDMPQLDHDEIGGKPGFAEMRTELPAGELNVAAPFLEESIDLRRWNKLAGILKD